MKDVLTETVEKNGESFYQVQIGEDLFMLPFKQIGGKNVAFLDISGQFVFIEACADNLTDQLIDKDIAFDVIVNPVSKSNALAHALAVRYAAKKAPGMTRTIVARKTSGSTGLDGSLTATYRSVTTPQDQTLCLTKEDAEYIKGKSVLILDDVYGGGGTFSCLQQLVKKAGGKVTAKAVAAIEEGATNAEDILHLFTLPVTD